MNIQDIQTALAHLGDYDTVIIQVPYEEDTFLVYDYIEEHYPCRFLHYNELELVGIGTVRILPAQHNNHYRQGNSIPMVFVDRDHDRSYEAFLERDGYLSEFAKSYLKNCFRGNTLLTYPIVV